MEIKASDLAKNITLEVTVKGMKIFNIRMKLAILIMKVAVFVGGVGIEIKTGG